METLSANFEDALTRIELRGERARLAQAAHLETRQVLEESTALKKWGVDSVLIGSYARGTTIFPGKDVDVFAKLSGLDIQASPQNVFTTVHEVLLAKYGKERIEPHRRSIRVKFDFPKEGETFSIDVVPAVRWEKRWGIPAGDRALWEAAEHPRRWMQTDPEKLAKLTTQRNSRLQVDGRGVYVPLVKLVKQIREQHLSENKPGGLYAELMIYWAFEQKIEEKSFAELLAAGLSSVAHQLQQAVTQPLRDPVLERPFDPQPSAAELSKAAIVFDGLAKDAARALTLTRCPAAAIWRRILGKNDRGWCFPLPDGCDETGRELTPVIAVKSRGSEEAHSFA